MTDVASIHLRICNKQVLMVFCRDYSAPLNFCETFCDITYVLSEVVEVHKISTHVKVSKKYSTISTNTSTKLRY